MHEEEQKRFIKAIKSPANYIENMAGIRLRDYQMGAAKNGHRIKRMDEYKLAFFNIRLIAIKYFLNPDLNFFAIRIYSFI